MSLKQRAVSGVLWSLVQQWGGQAFSFLVFLVLARLLTPEIFGLVALANVFIAFTQSFVGQGFASAIIQREELESEHLDTAFWGNLGLGILFTLAGVVGASLIAGFFDEPQLAPLVKWLSLIFIIVAFREVQEAILRRRLAFKVIAVRKLVATVGGGGVGIGMAVAGFGVWSLVGQQLVNGALEVAVLWAATNWKPRFRFSWKHYKDLFSFGINITGFTFLNFFNKRADDFLIGYFLGPIALGYYTIAYRIFRVMTTVLIGAVGQVAFPAFSRIQADLARLRNAFLTLTELTVTLALPVFLGIAVLAHNLLPAVFGSQWLPSVPVMRILAFAGMLISLSFGNYMLMVAMGRPSWRLSIHLVKTLIVLVALVLVVQEGIVAVAWALVLCWYLMYPIELLAIRKLLHLDLASYARTFVPPLIAGVTLAITIGAFQYALEDVLSPYVLIALSGLLGPIIYIATIYLVSPALIHKGMSYLNLLVLRARRVSTNISP